MIGPRDSVIRILLGEDVPMDDILRDQSEFVDSDSFARMPWYDRPPELWADKVRDAVGEDFAL